MPATSVRGVLGRRAEPHDQINRIRESPFLPASIDLHGFIYDVQTGKLREVSLPEEEIMANTQTPMH